jgi:hypothetical protein
MIKILAGSESANSSWNFVGFTSRLNEKHVRNEAMTGFRVSSNEIDKESPPEYDRAEIK